MLDEAQIAKRLHASRVVPVTVPNPHGPLGLEQLASEVATLRGETSPPRVERPIALSVQAWSKLNDLAHAQTNPQTNKPTSASELAAALLEHLIAGQS